MGNFLGIVVIALALIILLVLALAIYGMRQSPAALMAERAEVAAEKAEADLARERGEICADWHPAHAQHLYRPRGALPPYWPAVSFLAHNGVELGVVALIVVIAGLIVTRLA